jgi:hypothetical protein
LRWQRTYFLGITLTAPSLFYWQGEEVSGTTLVVHFQMTKHAYERMLALVAGSDLRVRPGYFRVRYLPMVAIAAPELALEGSHLIQLAICQRGLLPLAIPLYGAKEPQRGSMTTQ